ncbi:hypothetical protein ACS49_00545 [Bacillus cereus]|nr:hypothetical protein ACS49_00545 [Bacillus cereus]
MEVHETQAVQPRESGGSESAFERQKAQIGRTFGQGAGVKGTVCIQVGNGKTIADMERQNRFGRDRAEIGGPAGIAGDLQGRALFRGRQSAERREERGAAGETGATYVEETTA